MKLLWEWRADFCLGESADQNVALDYTRRFLQFVGERQQSPTVTAPKRSPKKPHQDKDKETYMNNFKHQGDITFVPVTDELTGDKEKHSGTFIVGYGEATGHHHKVTVSDPADMEVVRVADGFILRLKSEGLVTHEEHKEIRLAPGTYRVGHEREYDHFADSVRKVID